MVSHDPEGHAVPHFNFLDLTNAVVPFMMSLASCDANVFRVCGPNECNGTIYNAVSTVTWPNSHVAPQFCHLDLTNAIVWLIMPSALCDSNANYVIWPEKSCVSFQSSWHKECNGAIDDPIDAMCCQHQCQWHHVMQMLMPLVSNDTSETPGVSHDKKCHVAPHLNHLSLKNAMVFQWWCHQ